MTDIVEIKKITTGVDLTKTLLEIIELDAEYIIIHNRAPYQGRLNHSYVVAYRGEFDYDFILNKLVEYEGEVED